MDEADLISVGGATFCFLCALDSPLGLRIMWAIFGGMFLWLGWNVK